MISRKKIVRLLRRAYLGLRSNLKSRLTITVSGRELYFCTRSVHSKNWFYPRYIHGEPHEPCVTDLFVNKIDQGDIVFDIGANQGYFTVLSAKLSATGQVHSFELDPELIPLIRNSLELNGDICSVSIVQAAISESDGDCLSFSPHISGNLTTNSVLYADDSARVKVNSLTLKVDTYCKSAKVTPDFIKVDVEGAELSAIRGMRDTLKHHKPRLLIEIHPRQLRDFGLTPEVAINAIFDCVPDYSGYIVEEYRSSAANYLVPYDPVSFSYQDNPFVIYFEV